MARTFLLLTALAASLSLCAQQPMSPNQAPGVPQNVISVNPPPTVLVVGGGLYGPSVFMAPTANFATPQLPAGASVGGAGISLNNPVYLGVTSTLGPAPLVYEGGQPGYAYMPGGASAGAGVEAAAPSGRLINEMGPSYYAEAVPPPPTVSLGEVAASYRATSPHPVRVYVNAEGQQLERTFVVTGAAIASNVIPETVVVQQNVPQSPPAETQAPQAQAPQRPENQPPAANTMPQLPPAPPAETKQEPNRLPATATLLPLLGLLGLLSSGLGLWFLRMKR
jgi:hypothetical protein